MTRPRNVSAKLRTCDPMLKEYVRELEKENLRLHKRIAKLHVRDVSQQNEIASLKKAQPKQVVEVVNFAEIEKRKEESQT